VRRFSPVAVGRGVRFLSTIFTLKVTPEQVVSKIQICGNKNCARCYANKDQRFYVGRRIEAEQSCSFQPSACDYHIDDLNDPESARD